MDKKKKLIKVRLIALAVSALMLAAAMGMTLLQYQKFAAAYLSFNLTAMIVVNCVGALIMYLIVFSLLKKNIKDE